MQPPEDLDSQPEEDLDMQFPDDLDSQPEDLDMQSPDNLDSQPEDLDMQPPEDLDSQPEEDLDSQSEEDLDMQSPEDLDLQPEDLDLQPEDLATQSAKNSSYQPQFLSKDRAGRSQNMPENITPVKLFQLFFTVKEIENIIKQTNQQAIYIDFKSFWRPLTVTEAYHYLGCLVYIGLQPLRDLHDYWQLKIPIASCFSRDHFMQIWRVFIIRESRTSPQQSGDS